MCDTFVCPPSLSKTSHWIFAKNSDREPNEAQLIHHYPASERTSEQQVCTHISVAHTPHTFEVLLSQPIGMWGAEMGINEKGLAIGNEAVFTRMSIGGKNSGLTGMDMLRLALESCASAASAVEKIIQLNEQYGQDANGGYQAKFYYHNSFLIVDPEEAFVLETAGPFWVLEKVKGFRAISNGLSIGTEFDEIHPEAIAFARKNGWSKKGQDFNFSAAFSAFWMPRLASCSARRQLNEQKSKSGFGISDAFRALRSHASDPFMPHEGTTESVCMHASGLFCPQQTTASMVAELRQNAPHSIWMTGSSAPCLSIFKPLYLGEQSIRIPASETAHWNKWEQWHRKAIHQYKVAHQKIDSIRAAMESRWIEQDQEWANGTHANPLHVLSSEAWEKADEILDLLLLESGAKKSPLLYRAFWANQDRNLKKISS